MSLAKIAQLKGWGRDCLRLFFPAYCPVCRQTLVAGEGYCCLGCEMDLPLLDYPISSPNEVSQVFAGRVQLAGATALFRLTKAGPVRVLLHAMKYDGQYRIAEEIGKQLMDRIDRQIDYLVPIPMHRLKEHRRGFNQSERIARGMSRQLGVPIANDILVRRRRGRSQTEKNRFERWSAVCQLYGVNPHTELAGKTVLIVDDILTTGVTLEYCAGLLVERGAVVYLAVAAIGERL